MISTVIFDLDGLLADTEPLHCRAYQQSLAAHGVDLADDAYAEHWIRLGKGIGELVAERGLDLDPERLRSEKARCYLALVRAHAAAMPGALALLERLRGRKTLAVGTSCYREQAEAVLDRLAIRGYFDAVAAGEDVPRVKPAPDVFLLAGRRVGAAPAECVVLEDAEKGVLAAAAAGMPCIAVPNARTLGNDFSRASAVRPSLEDVTLELIDSLG